MMRTLIPAEFQPDLPMARLIRSEPPRQGVGLDVVFVGGGPAGLAGAIELARRARNSPAGSPLRHIEIGVLEKADSLGEHCLSGAVINPVSLRALFPALADRDLPFRAPVSGDRVYWLGARTRLRLPTPPSMRNRGNYVASICELARWMGAQAEALDVHILTGFAADALLTEGDRVLGVRTTAAGLDRQGQPGPAYQAPTDVAARVTVLAEGNRGALTQAWRAWRRSGSANPQIHALGVKELWRVDRPLDAVIHTLGWPLPPDVFGGSFFYPMAEDLVALGLVAGLDYTSASFDPHERLQDLKTHPLFARYLSGGELLEWGAKTIPEGGFHSLPERLSGDGMLLVGDAAGLVDVPSLKGIHYAVQSGLLAGRTLASALEKDDTSAGALERYDEALRRSFVWSDLERSRNVRLAFKQGLLRGGVAAALMTITRGRLSGPRIPTQPDAEHPRMLAGDHPHVEGSQTGRWQHRLSKADAVYHSGNDTRDDQPSHLLLPDWIPEDVARFYAHMCPAAVYEWRDDELLVHPSNCIDCKTTDVLGPRWLPREGGSGPHYRRM